MYCPRPDHFVRFNPNGTVSCCGHMANAPQFDTVDQMKSSSWLSNIKQQFEQDQWPSECVRCKNTEYINGSSIRLFALEKHNKIANKDYLQVGGVLDNVCNSACQICNAKLSTKIGSLHGKNFPIVDNSAKYWTLPQDKIILLDINGGEPSASKNYKYLLENLPPNVETVRVNTNAALVLNVLEEIANRGVEVIVTVSFDGIEHIHDYVRWPIKWEKFLENCNIYRSMSSLKVNFWTTVNALNVDNLDKILEFVSEQQIDHSYALLENPLPLNVKFKNPLTLAAKEKYKNSQNPTLAKLSDLIAIETDNTEELKNYINKNDTLRGINVTDYLGNIFGDNQ